MTDPAAGTLQERKAPPARRRRPRLPAKRRSTERLRFLFVAYAFPPIPYAGTYRTMRLCNGLAERGHSVEVVTLHPGRGIHRDPELTARLHGNVIVHRTRTVDPWLFYRKEVLPRARLRPLRAALGRFVSFISIPDHMVFWVPFAVRKCRDLLRERAVDFLYTTSPPHSEQLIGLALKRRFGVPWIADLRDPITENIAYDSDRIPRLQRLAEARLERSIVQHADAILVNTEHARRICQSKYPGCTRFRTLRNFYDPREFGRALPRWETFTISHVGSVYSHRNPEALFEAVSRLVRRSSGDPLPIRLNFVGLSDGRMQELVERYRLSSHVTLRDMVSHREALRIMQRSHLLLVLKGFGERGHGQIPGKLYEYIGSGNRILCIGPRESECSRIVEELGLGPCVAGDAGELARVLEREYERFRRRRPGTSSARIDRRRQVFSLERAIETFLSVAGEVADRAGSG
ncbi:MAG: glycosyltransferase [bacterium]